MENNNNITQIDITLSENVQVKVLATNINSLETFELFAKTVRANQNLLNQLNNVVGQFEQPKQLTPNTTKKELTIKNMVQFNKEHFRHKDKLKLFNQQFGTKFNSPQQIYNKIGYLKKIGATQ